MRRDDAVLRFQQRIIRADRLGVDHVQSRRSHLSTIERVGNVLLVNELTAGVIDEDDAVLHLGGAVLVDHAGVFRRKVAVQRNDVRVGVKLVQSNIFHDRATGVIRIEIVSQHVHAERLGDTRLGLTDASEADDGDGLTLQLDERIVPIAPVGVIRPVTCVYTIDSSCDSSKGWVSKPARCRQAQTSSFQV